MSNTPIWSRIDGPNGPSITVVFSTGETSIVSASHASQNKILLTLVNGGSEEEIRELINPVNTIAKRLRRLSSNVTTDGTNLFLDGTALHNSLASYILRLIREENTNPDAPSWEPFVKFLEKVSQNNSEESRESLFDFITLHGLTIQANGNFIGYKGVGDDLHSVRSGPGIVNNVVIENGRLNNAPGNIVEIDRNYVEADRERGCAQGLHVTTRAYASGWGPRVVVVSVNPRDVVSVPLGEVQKMRVCRYEVIEETTREIPAWAASENVVDSTPLYWGDAGRTQNILSDEDVETLKQAAENNARLTVTYHGKDYANSTVTFIDDTHVKIASEDFGHRTFFLNEVESIKETQAPVDEEIEKLRKELEELRTTGAKVNIKYHGRDFYGATVYRVGSTHVTIKFDNGFRTLFLNAVGIISEDSESDDSSAIRTQLEEAIASGEKVTVTYRGHRFENVTLRRIDGEWLKVQLSDTDDAGYRTFTLANVENVELTESVVANSATLSDSEKLIEERFLNAVKSGEDLVLHDSLGRALSVIPVTTELKDGALSLGVRIPSNNNAFEWLSASEWSIYLGGLS